jgi:hypothetical protein
MSCDGKDLVDDDSLKSVEPILSYERLTSFEQVQSNHRPDVNSQPIVERQQSSSSEFTITSSSIRSSSISSRPLSSISSNKLLTHLSVNIDAEQIDNETSTSASSKTNENLDVGVVLTSASQSCQVTNPKGTYNIEQVMQLKESFQPVINEAASYGHLDIVKTLIEVWSIIFVKSNLFYIALTF